jgi:hypothetical protein
MAQFSQYTKLTLSSQSYNPITRRWNTHLQYQLKSHVIDFEVTLAAIQARYAWIAETMVPRLGPELFEKIWGRTQVVSVSLGTRTRPASTETELDPPLG